MSEQILCTNCNAPNPRDTVFCGKCGARLAAANTEGMEVDPLLGKMVGDRFLVQAKLGEGGMGVVYRAEQTAIGRTVALKVLHPHLSQDGSLHARFQNEAAAASRLTHTNTITIYDFGRTSEGSLYIAMEFIKGRSLDEEIVKGGPLPWQRVVHIGVQICGSLQDAHQNNIVHRDLKPENIMLCDRSGDTDFVKVLDFGIAKILGDDSGDQRKNLTKTGMVFGTPQYMSPEQIRGEKVDHRTDIYSVGCILYEALAGRLPFTAETPMGVLTKHLMDPPPPLSTHALPSAVPPGIEAVVLSALAKNAADRPQTMQALAQELISAGLAAGMTPGALMMQTSAMSAHSGTQASTAVVAPPAGSSPQSSPSDVVATPTRVVGSVAKTAPSSGPSGTIIGIIAAVAAVVLVGGGLGWYFVLGPGASASSDAASVTTPQMPPPIAPPIANPLQPAGYQPPVAPPPNPSGNATVSLPAVPVDSAKSEPAKHTQGTKPQTAKDASCSYSGTPDEVSGAMILNLRRAEAKIKDCLKGVSAKTAIRFEVAQGSTQPDKLDVTTSSEMDACLKPYVGSALAKAADAARAGTATFTLGREKNAVSSCSVNVSTQVKGPIRVIDGIKPKVEDKPKDNEKKDTTKDKDKSKDTDGSRTRPGVLVPIKTKTN